MDTHLLVAEIVVDSVTLGLEHLHLRAGRDDEWRVDAEGVAGGHLRHGHWNAVAYNSQSSHCF